MTEPMIYTVWTIGTTNKDSFFRSYLYERPAVETLHAIPTPAFIEETYLLMPSMPGAITHKNAAYIEATKHDRHPYDLLTAEYRNTPIPQYIPPARHDPSESADTLSEYQRFERNEYNNNHNGAY